MNRQKVISNLALLFATVVWGSTFIVTKTALQGVNAITLCSYRCLLAAGLIGIGLAVTKKNPLQNWRQGALLGLLLFGVYITQIPGLNYISASSSGFITGLFLVFVPIFNFVFWRSKLSWFDIVATLLALSGLWVITGGVRTVEIGELLTLLGAICFAFYVLFADHFIKKSADIWILNFQQFFIIGVLSLFITLAFRLPLQITTWYAFNSIIYLSIFASIIAYAIQLQTQTHLNPFTVTLVLSFEPIFAAIFAWTVGGEAFTWTQGIGGLFIFSAIILVQLAEFKNKPKELKT
jgi:drug/metabolite transporter (DMT)-like permease